jgi:type I restriction-modification system DNA methylase subunit
MAIFQKSIVEKYLNSLDESLIENAFDTYRSVYVPKIDRIRNLKEEQYQTQFLQDIFGSILGYTIDPEAGYNIELEKKNESNSKKADGAIVKEDKVLGVIELKSNKTKNLDSIKDQAFGYKNNHKGCNYVISSNFHKLRFYVDDATEYEEFDLYNLDKESFKKFYLFLRKEGLLDKNIPKLLKEETKFHEENISKQLYKDYSSFKNKFFENIVKNNPEVDKLILFKKSQKFLDRILFVLFAEDKNLIPTNAIPRIVESWALADDLHYKPLYELFKTFFIHLNVGHVYKSGYEIPAYGGGLFMPDEVLDNLKVDDGILKDDLLVLSKYDFNTDVDVNILGHIFEHSLSEIEETEAKLKGEQVDKSKGKRKKDGVFYTPKYITKYIVDNTLGKLCNEKKSTLELDQDFDLVDYQKSGGGVNKKGEKLFHTLESYKKWLLELKIVDPACGSGAFLNEALSFLIKEHKEVDDLIAELTNTPLRIFDTEKSILENNIYGVDINEESVEIAKLSMWLRTAQKGRQLSDLSNNIKCGNSLIDDVAVAGEKAFNWKQEFPKIFAKGGFDVVIGNPPYVFARDNFSQEIKNYYSNNYVSAEYQINLYLLFIERTISLIKEKANYGLIIPNAWLMVDSAKGLRNLVLKSSFLDKIINLAGYSFEGINVETIIVLATKSKEDKSHNNVDVFLSSGKEFKYSHKRKQIDFEKNKGFEFKVFSDETSVELTRKLRENSEDLDNLVQIKAGLQAYEKNKGEPKQSVEDVKNRPYDFNYKFDENTHKYLEGRDVGRYFINWSGEYLQYGKQLASPRTINLFDNEKIIVREITGKFPKSIISTYNNELYLYNRSNIGIIKRVDKNISLKFVVAILNSRLMAYYFMKNTAKSVRKMFPKIILNDLRKFPFKEISENEQTPFVQKTDNILSFYKNLINSSNKFKRTLKRKFESLEKLSKKLENWHELTFMDFVKELKKRKIKLSLTEEAEWEDYFLVEQQKAIEIKAQITKLDKEIDVMVYELYGLTDEEIAIIEND